MKPLSLQEKRIGTHIANVLWGSENIGFAGSSMNGSWDLRIGITDYRQLCLGWSLYRVEQGEAG